MICRRPGCETPVLTWLYPRPWCSPDCRHAETAAAVTLMAERLAAHLLSPGLGPPVTAPHPRRLWRDDVARAFDVPVHWLGPAPGEEHKTDQADRPVARSVSRATGGLDGWLPRWFRHWTRRNS